MDDGPPWVWQEEEVVTEVADAEAFITGGLEPKGPFLGPSVKAERAWSLAAVVW